MCTTSVRRREPKAHRARRRSVRQRERERETFAPHPPSPDRQQRAHAAHGSTHTTHRRRRRRHCNRSSVGHTTRSTKRVRLPCVVSSVVRRSSVRVVVTDDDARLRPSSSASSVMASCETIKHRRRVHLVDVRVVISSCIRSVRVSVCACQVCCKVVRREREQRASSPCASPDSFVSARRSSLSSSLFGCLVLVAVSSSVSTSYVIIVWVGAREKERERTSRVGRRRSAVIASVSSTFIDRSTTNKHTQLVRSTIEHLKTKQKKKAVRQVVWWWWVGGWWRVRVSSSLTSVLGV